MKYRTIVADPPWPYENGFTASLPSGRDMHIVTGKPVKRYLPYASMSIADIEALPVGTLADLSGCRLFLWTTNKYLGTAFGVMSKWGFKYKQTLVWNKLVASPFAPSIAMNTAEFILVGTIGSPKRLDFLRSAVISHGRPKKHAYKPEIFIDLIEQVSPGPYVELFARRHRFFWDVWGNESANTAEMPA